MAVSKESHFYIDTDYTKDFRDALVNAGASSFANLSIDPAVLSGAARLFITTIRILCMQSGMDWRLEFYSKASGTGHTGGYITPSNNKSGQKFASAGFASFGQVPTSFPINGTDLCGFVGGFLGSVTQGEATPTIALQTVTNVERLATAYGTMFAYFASNLRIPYVDLDSTRGGGELHVNLVNTNGGKTAGDSGAVQIRFGMVASA